MKALYDTSVLFGRSMRHILRSPDTIIHSMPLARSSLLWSHVLTSLVSNAIPAGLIIIIALIMGFRSSADGLAWLAVTGILALFTLALTWLAMRTYRRVA